jgi:hypothetical protein
VPNPIAPQPEHNTSHSSSRHLQRSFGSNARQDHSSTSTASTEDAVENTTPRTALAPFSRPSANCPRPLWGRSCAIFSGGLSPQVRIVRRSHSSTTHPSTIGNCWRCCCKKLHTSVVAARQKDRRQREQVCVDRSGPAGVARRPIKGPNSAARHGGAAAAVDTGAATARTIYATTIAANHGSEPVVEYDNRGIVEACAVEGVSGGGGRRYSAHCSSGVAAGPVDGVADGSETRS